MHVAKTPREIAGRHCYSYHNSGGQLGTGLAVQAGMNGCRDYGTSNDAFLPSQLVPALLRYVFATCTQIPNRSKKAQSGETSIRKTVTMQRLDGRGDVVEGLRGSDRGTDSGLWFMCCQGALASLSVQSAILLRYGTDLGAAHSLTRPQASCQMRNSSRRSLIKPRLSCL